ncbi:hypothetical protein [Paraurantiacibacter namhicola]|uniref:Alpha/beta hydrolase family protein n=1 Tax=Paraurantiacibacter namhicola TaxID=645517 RepID=A0A1C7D4H1_9SPHN|nr:hypothetical protein [Paraurantiacibacter namhicola]ANU06350.1 hypothetical protein A6F65_00022 [Paraurantiacibacter namhicola]
MQRLVALFCLLLAALAMPTAASAQGVITTTTIEEYEIDESGREVLVSSRTITERRAPGATMALPPQPLRASNDTPAYAPSAARFVSPLVATTESEAIAAYGPFRVLDDGRAALVDITDSHTPTHFEAMLAAHPGIASLQLVEVPGTYDDRANLALGRMIRARGIATHVPEGGSVRSGGVELYLAGASRSAHPEAQFAVHAWMDQDGLEANDYAADSPEHRRYLDYYAEMGMEPGEARDFYWMTNSVGFGDALWLTGADMAQWVPEEEPEIERAPVLAYLDLGGLLQ